MPELRLLLQSAEYLFLWCTSQTTEVCMRYALDSITPSIVPLFCRYFGFISKHPLLPRFACHVFLSNESTQAIVEAIGFEKRFFPFCKHCPRFSDAPSSGPTTNTWHSHIPLRTSTSIDFFHLSDCSLNKVSSSSMLFSSPLVRSN
jgi:hypothetical protein